MKVVFMAKDETPLTHNDVVPGKIYKSTKDGSVYLTSKGSNGKISFIVLSHNVFVLGAPVMVSLSDRFEDITDNCELRVKDGASE